MSARKCPREKGETYLVEMCFEVGGGMKHSKVRYQEGGERGELSRAGRDLLISFRRKIEHRHYILPVLPVIK